MYTLKIKLKTMGKNIFSTCGLCVGIVIVCNVLVPVYSQQSLVSSTTNTSTITGETIEFDCAGLTKLTIITTFKWFLNDTTLPIEKNKMRMSLDKNGRALRITNVTSRDDGIYKCIISNKYRSDYSIFNLTVQESPYLKIHKRAVINDTLNVGEMARLNCFNELLQDTKEDNIRNLTWLKNGIPYFANYGEKVKLSRDDLILVIKEIVLEDQGIYECTASNNFRIDNAVYNITVVDSPNTMVYNRFNGNFTRYYGESVAWSCILNTKYSVDNFTYTWFKNNVQIRPHSGNKRYTFEYNLFTIQISRITHEDEGNYSCSASNVHNITGHLNFSLNILDKPEIINYKWYTSCITAEAGVDLLLRCELFYSSTKFKTETNIYQWYTNDVKLSKYFQIDSNAMTNETFYLYNVIFDNTGTYKCDSSNLYFKFQSAYILQVVDPPEPKNNGKKILILLFIILLSASIVFMACYVISLKREQALKKMLQDIRSQFENGDIDKWNPDLGIEDQAELLPYDKQWEFPKANLKLGKQLGSGAFGVVFKADAIGIIDQNITSTVAVKMIRPNSEPCYTKALISELKIMIHIGKHLNVVNLLGACTEDLNNNLMVIVEFCRFGNIRNYLLKHRDCFINQITADGSFNFKIKATSRNLYNEIGPNNSSITGEGEKKSTSVDPEGYLLPDELEPIWRNNYRGDYNSGNTQPLSTHDLLCWSLQIARGMEYLANKKILHGDLAIRNILLADDNVIKICDFGFAKTMINSETYKKSSSVPLPIKWMAIESIRDRVFSIQSDVWSFGVVLWEIFSLAVNPYPNIESCHDLFIRLADGYRMEQPKYANSQLYKIMLNCWNANPQTRPSFTDLVEYLSDFLTDVSKSYYVDLNEAYVKKFTKNTPSDDYINMFASPNYEKCLITSENDSNLNLKENASKNMEKKNNWRKIKNYVTGL